jgi:hypothetical protein
VEKWRARTSVRIYTSRRVRSRNASRHLGIVGKIGAKWLGISCEKKMRFSTYIKWLFWVVLQIVVGFQMDTICSTTLFGKTRVIPISACLSPNNWHLSTFLGQTEIT